MDKEWLGALLIMNCLRTVQKIKACSALEPCSKAPGGGPGASPPEALVFFNVETAFSPPEALVFFNVETAFSTTTYTDKIVKFKTLLLTKLRQPMSIEQF